MDGTGRIVLLNRSPGRAGRCGQAAGMVEPYHRIILGVNQEKRQAVVGGIIHGDFSIGVKSKRCWYNLLTGTALVEPFRACYALDSLHLRIRITAQLERTHDMVDDDTHAGRGFGLSGNPPLVSAEKRFAAGSRARWNHAQLLHPAEHINHRPAILHLPIHDAEQAHLLDLEALARRRGAEECARTLVRSTHSDAGSNLVSLCDAILEREVEIRERAP